MSRQRGQRQMGRWVDGQLIWCFARPGPAPNHAQTLLLCLGHGGQRDELDSDAGMCQANGLATRH